MELYQLVDKKKVSPIEFISKIETVIKAPVVVKSIEWAAEEKSPAGTAKTVTVNKAKINAVFTLDFPEVKTIEDWRGVSKKLLADMKEAFKGYDIAFSKVPSKFLETEKMDITFDAPAKPAAPNEHVEVQLTVKEL